MPPGATQGESRVGALEFDTSSEVRCGSRQDLRPMAVARAASEKGSEMSITTTASATTAPTEFLRVKDETYAYRRIGGGFRRPLLCLQHFTGTLDNWDPAVTDPLGDGREVILFDSAGVGRSTGTVRYRRTGFRAMMSHGSSRSWPNEPGWTLGSTPVTLSVRDTPRRRLLRGRLKDQS